MYECVNVFVGLGVCWCVFVWMNLSVCVVSV
jgi:hypothetical protein